MMTIDDNWWCNDDDNRWQLEMPTLTNCSQSVEIEALGEESANVHFRGFCSTDLQNDHNPWSAMWSQSWQCCNDHNHAMIVILSLQLSQSWQSCNALTITILQRWKSWWSFSWFYPRKDNGTPFKACSTVNSCNVVRIWEKMIFHDHPPVQGFKIFKGFI